MTNEELKRLIDVIVSELAAPPWRAAGFIAPHGALGDRPAVCGPPPDTGATRGRALGGRPPGVAAMIDHTLPKPDATRGKSILPGKRLPFRRASTGMGGPRPLSGSGVSLPCRRFPLGATTADVKRYETQRAIFDGAREIDMVINVGALKSGDLRVVERDIEAVVSPCRECGVLSKVIIEAALLTDDEKVTACTLAKAAGADYVKTSTGFGPGGATAADVALMRRVVGAEMGVKAAGGVRDLEGVNAMIAAGATRVGASAGVKIVQQAREARTP
jgi:deoxyribose-phosphate aldolase